MRPRECTRVVPMNVATAPASSGRDLLDDGLERQRLLAQQEGAARDGRDQRHLVAVRELVVALDVRLVQRVQQSRRLVAEVERSPDVTDPRDAVDVALRPARALAQTGEQPHLDSHSATA